MEDGVIKGAGGDYLILLTIRALTQLRNGAMVTNAETGFASQGPTEGEEAIGINGLENFLVLSCAALLKEVAFQKESGFPEQCRPKWNRADFN